MKKSILLALVVCSMSLTTFNATAATDDKYPAANFEPKVTFIDENAVQSSASTSVSDDKYPAANFQPKVTYIDESVSGSSASQAATEPAQFDAKYPAAYFTPKIIYP